VESQFEIASDLLFRYTSDGVLILDADDVLVRMNPAAAAMLHCAPEDCLGKHASSLFKDQPALLALLTESGQTTRRIPLPDKRIAIGIGHDEVNGEETGPDAAAGGGRLVLLQDITEREELESRREQLIYRISHDLSNPISAIEGFAELIGMYGTLNTDQQKFVTRIRQTSHKLRDLVQTLVDLTWVEAGMPMSSVPVSLDRLISEVVAELSPQAQARQISIAVSTQQPMPIVLGDPMRLKQAIYNLVHNALLYSLPEHPIAIHAYEDRGQIRCTVADRGIGIPEHELGQIFDRLYRVPDERVRNLPGGGIGLTMAQAILKRHGGTIRAESVYGQGSTFILTLPLA
jgi:signal transduction histidine kinase